MCLPSSQRYSSTVRGRSPARSRIHHPAQPAAGASGPAERVGRHAEPPKTLFDRVEAFISSLSVRDNFWPMATGADAARHFQGYLNTALTVIMMTCVIIVLANALWKWLQVLSGRVAPVPEPPPAEA